MALYKQTDLVKKSGSEAFDKVHKPGEITPLSGIYRCTSCGDEVASNKGNPLPPQNHAQHEPKQGDIRWQLLVFAQQKKVSAESRQ